LCFPSIHLPNYHVVIGRIKDAQPVRTLFEVSLMGHRMGLRAYTVVLNWRVQQRSPLAPKEVNDVFRALTLAALAASWG
jgi:hypothetical protein